MGGWREVEGRSRGESRAKQKGSERQRPNVGKRMVGAARASKKDKKGWLEGGGREQVG